jgi:hypothetical protein
MGSNCLAVFNCLLLLARHKGLKNQGDWAQIMHHNSDLSLCLQILVSVAYTRVSHAEQGVGSPDLSAGAYADLYYC